MAYNLGKTADRALVLEVVRVRNLTGSPRSLVCGVVDHRGVPLALVFWIGLQRTIKQ